MSTPLVAAEFPLRGSRLIEASAGTGKTWTIAALYVRLVLGHGGENAYPRPLAPAEILVMTFTRAATRELSERVRARLLDAAHCFRGQPPQPGDSFMAALLADYPDEQQRQQAAHRLMLAAEAMDECAIFTIDAWCQRMLREHAFDSGSLFDEELVASEDSLFADAARDYWRQQVYPLEGAALDALRECWKGVRDMQGAMRELCRHAGAFGDAGALPLERVIDAAARARAEAAAALKPGWGERVARMRDWMALHGDSLNGNKLRKATVAACFDALDAWAADAGAVEPGAGFYKGCGKLTPDHIAECFKKGHAVVEAPEEFAALDALQQQLSALEPVAHAIRRHAACRIAQRMAEIKRSRRQFGFADMLARLRDALEGANGDTLAQRIVTQYPVALIDEFQDTSPEQYRIFDRLYRIADNRDEFGLFLIGDPKQAIYGFRGADIHSYLAARRATEGRHYLLDTNYRSTQALVAAVNRLFLHAEGGQEMPGHAAGAFRFRSGADNPLPFEPVAAHGRAERLITADGEAAAMTIWCTPGSDMKVDDYRAHFAACCAERIVALLGDARAGFEKDGVVTPLKPADIAVLVRDRKEAAFVRKALQLCGVRSVFLSDQDSVFDSDEAADMLRWLRAVATPLDSSLARAAFATRTAGLSLQELEHLAGDDQAWEARMDQLKMLHTVWQRHGVLAMLRRFIHELGLQASLQRELDGERRLTNLLHLAELLQAASRNLDGEHALIRWLAEQAAGGGDGGDERVLRLESDAELVQVVTVHKSKGLEYPLVFLPFAVSAKPVGARDFYAYVDAQGARRLDLAKSEQALESLEKTRIEEDLRLLYVALTRARHALWLGVTSLKDKIHESAFGYLLGGGEAIAGAALQARLQQMCGGCAAISIVDAQQPPARTRLARPDRAPPLRPAPHYEAQFERNWKIASYSSITRALGELPAPATPLADKLAEDDDRTAVGKPQDAPWHRFPRGALPGQFLHEQLEWIAGEGFASIDDPAFEARLRARCDRAGWGHRQDDAVDWLRAVVATPLPPLGAPLRQVEMAAAETEFWFPAEGLSTAALDALCQRHLLEGIARAPMSERTLHGMLRGFKDLVFLHGGRYWVLDYKSNALAADDDGYREEALAQGMAAHRYDVQGAIYMLALHRLLKSRLGAAYDPLAQLGGAIFYFMRGLQHPQTHGCYHLAADAGLLDALDQLLPAPAAMEDSA